MQDHLHLLIEIILSKLLQNLFFREIVASVFSVNTIPSNTVAIFRFNCSVTVSLIKLQDSPSMMYMKTIFT